MECGRIIQKFILAKPTLMYFVYKSFTSLFPSTFRDLSGYSDCGGVVNTVACYF